ncbi:MAG: anti-sigma factor family protein [Planctomycetota bacterium]|jgi:hypothetical protein
MTNKTCNRTAELLVQYADGELPADDARRVAEHLADCPVCRAEVRLLGRSLDLAREVWQESAARAASPSTASAKQWHTLARGTASRTRPDRRRIYAAACLAACAVLLLLTAGPWLFSRWQPGNEVAIPGKVDQPPHPQPAEQIDLEALIAREGRSARLLAAAQMLATEPGLEEYKRQAERYLAEAYRGTAAVNGALPPTHSPPNKEPES